MRKPFLAFVAVLPFVAFGVYGYLHLQRTKAEAAIYQHPDLRYGIMIRTPSMKRVADHRREAILNHAKMLREKWRPWAEQHKDLIVEAKNSKPNNEAIMRKLYLSIPDGVGPDWKLRPITSTMLAPEVHSIEDYARQDIFLRFTWNIDHKDNQIYAFRKQDFARFRNFSISQSMNVGRAYVSVWADGRVTETVQEHSNVPGRPSLTEGVPIEIVPPYEFIK